MLETGINYKTILLELDSPYVEDTTQNKACSEEEARQTASSWVPAVSIVSDSDVIYQHGGHVRKLLTAFPASLILRRSYHFKVFVNAVAWEKRINTSPDYALPL